MVLDEKSSQECSVLARVHQGFILGSKLFVLYINDLADSVISNIAIYADDTTPYSGIRVVAITRIGFWTWIWSTRHCGLGQKVACWYQCWENSNGFIRPV